MLFELNAFPQMLRIAFTVDGPTQSVHAPCAVQNMLSFRGADKLAEHMRETGAEERLRTLMSASDMHVRYFANGCPWSTC